MICVILKPRRVNLIACTAYTSLFRWSWEVNAIKLLHSKRQKIWKTQKWPEDWIRLVFPPVSKKGNAKECSNNQRIAFISHTSKVMFNVLQARRQKYMKWEIPDLQDGLRKILWHHRVAFICSGYLFFKFVFQLLLNGQIKKTFKTLNPRAKWNFSIRQIKI